MHTLTLSAQVDAGLVAPSPVQSPAANDDPEKTELKAKLNKTKRTALGFKSKLADAIAAKDEALAQLAALQGQSRSADSSTSAQPATAAGGQAFHRPILPGLLVDLVLLGLLKLHYEF